MKPYIIIVLLILSNAIKAQKPLDTIYANDTKNVALFFNSPIRQGITGASNFVFTYNREKEQYFGLLQAKPGGESNLLTITGDGQVYSYILKYKDSISKLNYFVSERQSIGNEKPEPAKKVPMEKNRSDSRIKYYQKFSDYLLKNDPKRIASKRKYGIKLQLLELVYDNAEVYMVFDLDNNSGIDFEVDYLNVFRVNGDRKSKSSFQKLHMEGKYEHNKPKVIKDKASVQFVYVLPKFVPGKNEKMLVELNELNGNRKIVLKHR
ncbi:DUF4138 domain-containing protein [Seonamhaeicola marinus]|uniref:DUF4138 domain-containing protein n=1 Tax=Seonamhaeicola marinus TaxID=1912246 RepID=A0A5D0J3I7_9FLAO|nr:DUF4138 domain-containing protein [Seonamhaeicola marinus]TYA89177.1 DUF4138 domain-containing protein [Seonamhaeicola marinus]